MRILKKMLRGQIMTLLLILYSNGYPQFLPLDKLLDKIDGVAIYGQMGRLTKYENLTLNSKKLISISALRGGGDGINYRPSA